MNTFKVLCAVACLLAATCANPTSRSNVVSGSLKPSHWLSRNELEDIPSLDELTWEKMENMPLESGAKLMQKLCKF